MPWIRQKSGDRPHTRGSAGTSIGFRDLSGRPGANHRRRRVLSLTMQRLLEEKIRNRKAKVGIVGLGYVGLPLAVEFVKAGFEVIGIDLSESKVAKVTAGEAYIAD